MTECAQRIEVASAGPWYKCLCFGHERFRFEDRAKPKPATYGGLLKFLLRAIELLRHHHHEIIYLGISFPHGEVLAGVQISCLCQFGRSGESSSDGSHCLAQKFTRGTIFRASSPPNLWYPEVTLFGLTQRRENFTSGYTNGSDI